MRASSLLTCTTLAILLSRIAAAEDARPAGTAPPSTGIDFIASGSALAAFGVLSFATSPLCETGIVIQEEQRSCLGVSWAVGAPFLAAGVSLIVVGAIQHGKYAAWARSHPAFFGLALSPSPGGGAVGWGATF